MLIAEQLRDLAHELNNEKAALLIEAANQLEAQQRDLVAKSWEGAVDRQGGSFDQDEIDQREQW